MRFDSNNTHQSAKKLMKKTISKGRRFLNRGFRLVGKITGRGQNEQFSEIALVTGWLLKERKQGIMVDVGAHYGESFSPYADAGWRVLAFEPDPNPDKWRMLSKHESRPNVTILRKAVDETGGRTVSFYASNESTGVSSMHQFLSSHKLVAEVETTTLSENLAKQEIQAIDFLKIDTEGHDLMVLKGHDWRIRTDAILCEFEDSKTEPLGYNYHDLGSYLMDKGYVVLMSEWHPIVRYGVQHRWHSIRRYPCDLKNPDGWWNFMAFRKDCLPSFACSARTHLPKNIFE